MQRGCLSREWSLSWGLCPEGGLFPEEGSLSRGRSLSSFSLDEVSVERGVSVR